MDAHHPQHVTLANEGDVAGLLSFGGGFIIAAADGGSNAEGFAGMRDAQDQRPAVTGTDGQFHQSALHQVDTARSHSFREQHRTGRIMVGERYGFKLTNNGRRQIANDGLGCSGLLWGSHRLSGHICLHSDTCTRASEAPFGFGTIQNAICHASYSY